MNTKKILLYDGLGALLSAIMHAFVLVKFQELIGMPESVLVPLGIVAACFMVYSLSSYFFSGSKWRGFLKVIAIANLLFCVVSAFLVIKCLDSLTTMGVLYFVGEILIVSGLAIYELKVSRKAN